MLHICMTLFLSLSLRTNVACKSNPNTKERNEDNMYENGEEIQQQQQKKNKIERNAKKLMIEKLYVRKVKYCKPNTYATLR